MGDEQKGGFRNSGNSDTASKARNVDSTMIIVISPVHCVWRDQTQRELNSSYDKLC